MSSDREKKIEERAYSIWVSSGKPHGQHDDHWHKAREEVEAEEGKPAKAAGASRPSAPAEAVAPHGEPSGAVKRRTVGAASAPAEAAPKAADKPAKTTGIGRKTGTTTKTAPAATTDLVEQKEPAKQAGKGKSKPETKSA